MRAVIVLIFSLLSPAYAGEGLLFLEAQAVGGYSSAQRALVYHSMSSGAPMQKTSAGFDLVRKFSSDKGDTGTLAVQGRLAYDPDAPNRLEPQLYNAYYRFRAGPAYAWFGHNRIAAGLESYYDVHGALLQTLPMYGYGLDRDWGLGVSKDFGWGDAACSLTTGSGMRLRAAGGRLASCRAGLGVLARDNHTAGLYASAGRVPATEGYTLLDGAEAVYSAFGADAALLADRWEFRSDLRAGRLRGGNYFSGLARAGLNVLEENRLKLEAQAVYAGLEHMEGWTLSSGASYLISPALSCRAMFEYEDRMKDRRLVTQLYYYLPI